MTAPPAVVHAPAPSSFSNSSSSNPKTTFIQDNDVYSTADHTNSTESSFPFLPNNSTTLLPKYSASDDEDINQFIFKLKMFLSHPSINNCHLHKSTTTHNSYQSSNLAKLLTLCISGDALSPFINDDTFNDKGIEMYHHLMEMKYPTSSSNADAAYNAMYNFKIKTNETIAAFGARLRTTYKQCIKNGLPTDDRYLVRCFIRGLDSNFDETRKQLSTGALNWHDLPFKVVLLKAQAVQMNLIASNQWSEDSGTANVAGKQGAARPDPNNTKPKQDNSNGTDPAHIPNYLKKTSHLHFKEVEKLFKRYACPLCRHNNHAFHECPVLNNTYCVTFKSPPTTQPQRSTNQRPTGSAGRVTFEDSITLPDTAERYQGYEVLASPPGNTDSPSSSPTPSVPEDKQSKKKQSSHKLKNVSTS
jgi:hypothetical protein